MSEVKNIGRNIARIRELKGVKQEILAEKLGISQQMISKIELSKEVDVVMLEGIALALGVTSTAIRNFNEDAIFNNFQTNTDTTNPSIVNYQFNPIEKVEALYDALLKSEREKIELLEKVIKKLEG